MDMDLAGVMAEVVEDHGKEDAAEELARRREKTLDALAAITNSKAFREDLGVGRFHPENEAAIALRALLRDDMEVHLDELTRVRRLGEGGFAYVDLYTRSAASTADGREIKYAVKEMKDRMLVPSEDPYATPRLVVLPEGEKIKFLAEAALSCQLVHPNVVGCFGCVCEESQRSDGTTPPYKLIQEFCGGGSLLDKLQRGRATYSVSDAMRWLHETALGMAYLHESGGMHRDLKPENVLLTEEGVAKVADFGLFRMDRVDASTRLQLERAQRERRIREARHSAWATPQSPLARLSRKSIATGQSPLGRLGRKSMSPNRGRGDSPDRGRKSMSPDRGRGDSPGRRLSMLPSAVWGKLEASAKEISTKTGTSRYMAPECFQVSEQMGNTYTNKVDVFSFAILSWELLARKRAYEDTYMTMDMAAKCVHENRMRPKLPTKWSDPIKTLLQRAWAQDPNDRPSFAELARELDVLHKGAQERSSAKGTTVANELGLEDGAAGGCCGIM